VSDGALFLTLLTVFGGLGFILGRRFWVLLVFVSAVVFWWIWYATTQKGPETT
jgi:hypothetical protein